LLKRLLKWKKVPTVDISLDAEALELPFSEKGWWGTTPTVVRHFIIEREKASFEDKRYSISLHTLAR